MNIKSLAITAAVTLIVFKYAQPGMPLATIVQKLTLTK